jgi:hypothetical protein
MGAHLSERLLVLGLVVLMVVVPWTIVLVWSPW